MFKVSNELDSQNVTQRQAGGEVGGPLTNTISTALASVLGYIGTVVYRLPDSFKDIGSGQSIENISLVHELKIRNVDGFRQLTFGLINSQNKLVMANILTIDQVRPADSTGNETNLLSRLSLSSVHSLMTSLVNDLQDINEPKVLSALKVSINTIKFNNY